MIQRESSIFPSPSVSPSVKQYFHLGWAEKYSLRILQYANKIFISAKYFAIYYYISTSSCVRIKSASQFSISGDFIT